MISTFRTSDSQISESAISSHRNIHFSSKMSILHFFIYSILPLLLFFPPLLVWCGFYFFLFWFSCLVFLLLFFSSTPSHSTQPKKRNKNRAETRAKQNKTNKPIKETQPNTTIKEARGWVFSCLDCGFIGGLIVA